MNAEIPSSGQKLLVCLGRTCRRYNSQQVFNNFQQNLPPDTELVPVGCLGQCGNGPMVLVESDMTAECGYAQALEFKSRERLTWYWQVHPQEVEIIIKQHLIDKCPVKAMLYPKFHH
ncbi:hypothetical protein NIES4102_09650 [Chondrocystis sp. NIES-4102]|nr:hypothetical protein NIES4102_09650 [Chondrocystis sp. NIES-4102]